LNKAALCSDQEEALPGACYQERLIPMMIQQLLDLLNWSDTTELFVELGRVHANYACTRMGQCLGRIASIDERESASLREDLGNLPEDGFMRLLTAPQTFCRLSSRTTGQDISSFLSDSLSAEYCRLGFVDHAPRAVWTALGDWYFPVGPLTDRQTDELWSLAWCANQVYRAPCLRNGIPVDFSSPFVRGKIPGISGTTDDFTEAELKQVLAKLDETLCSIERISSFVYDLITHFTKVVVVRNDLSEPDEFKSATSPWCIGSPVFRNPHLDYVGVDRLVDGWVHETIHCMLDIVEFKGPFLLDPKASSDVRLSSPWSGKSLDLDTYIQACFVWYGICAFWLLARESGVFDAEAVERCISRSSCGFVLRDVVHPLEKLSSVLSPGLPDVLRGAQERIRTAVRSHSNA
jgi:hypothetical protein